MDIVSLDKRQERARAAPAVFIDDSYPDNLLTVEVNEEGSLAIVIEGKPKRGQDIGPIAMFGLELGDVDRFVRRLREVARAATRAQRNRRR